VAKCCAISGCPRLGVLMVAKVLNTKGSTSSMDLICPFILEWLRFGVN
jgi:hypothetical protein